MSQNFDQVFSKIRRFLEKNESQDEFSAELFGREIGISAAQISRLRNGKSGISDKVIAGIVDWLRQKDEVFAVEIGSDLERLRNPSAFIVTSELSRDDTIRPIEDFFSVLAAADHAMVCVDYRDSPQVKTIPYLAGVVAQAINRGLCFAMFQPFGPQEDLLQMHEKYIEKIKNSDSIDPDDTVTAQAYFHLFRLAHAVRQVYGMIRGKASNKDRIALYEAEKTDYSLNAIGLQSRLFYTRYEIDHIRITKVFDWITGPNNQHNFVERDSRDISFDAVRTQFYPVPSFWEREDNTFRLPKQEDLDSLYGSGDWQVKWKEYED